MIVSEKKITVSVIIPCRNEEKFINKCLDSIIDNEYPKDRFEILVVDGMSEDGTRDIIKKFSQKYSFINLLDNHKKIVPTALNIGIHFAKGDIIIRMDAHNVYEKHYILKCVQYIRKYSVDNIGGIWITSSGSDSMIAKSIAFALSHSFGVGNSYFRVGSQEPRFTDTVPFGCYKKEVFERIGLFNENLMRNQDIEFNLRLKRAGGRILLVPDVISYYHARSNLKDLFKQNFLNGYWVIYGSKFAKLPFSLRHLIPFAFVISLLSSFIMSFFYTFFIYTFGFILGSYLIANAFYSFKLSFKNGLHHFPFVISTFLTLHFSYGLGSVWGFSKVFLKNSY